MVQTRTVDLDKMNSMEWYHKIDLGDGIVTPGVDFDRIWGHISQFLDGIDFANKTVLDIGCWDGKWSFEAERRGAKLVVATDDISQRTYGSEEQFTFARAALGSKALYYPDISVYNIDQVPEAPFDIVLFLGVLYHLHYPFYAISKIRQVLKEGGILVVETACMNDLTHSFMEMQLGLHYTIYEDPTTWCAPSIVCLREMLESSYFDVKRDALLAPKSSPELEAPSPISKLKRLMRGSWGRSTAYPPKPQVERIVVESRAVVRSNDKHAVPDPLLRQFDRRFRM